MMNTDWPPSRVGWLLFGLVLVGTGPLGCLGRLGAVSRGETMFAAPRSAGEALGMLFDYALCLADFPLLGVAILTKTCKRR